MKAKVIKASQLATNCWLPARLFGRCWDCDRYFYCTYPERVANREYDNLFQKLRLARRALAEWREKHKLR